MNPHLVHLIKRVIICVKKNQRSCLVFWPVWRERVRKSGVVKVQGPFKVDLIKQ